jgi:hypothetical protein
MDYNGIEYYVTNQGKEKAAAGKLLNIWKTKYPEATTSQARESFTSFFRACVHLNDDFLQKNMSIPIILSSLNKINGLLKHGTGKRNGTGATDAEIAGIIAKYCATDYPGNINLNGTL